MTGHAPMTPADADLTDFRFMPLDVQRLQKSKAWLICKRKPELAFYMLNLWLSAWHERPAGSLEDDDDVLADAAKCSPEKWPKVKADVLRNWILCSDGRLYHEVVAEKVNEAWTAKLAQRARTTAARVAALTKRLQQATDPAVKEQIERELLRLRPVLSPPPTVSVTEPATQTETESKGQGQGQGDSKTPTPSAPVSGDAAPSAPPDTPSDLPKSSKGSRLPSDWTLPDGWREWATTEALGGGDRLIEILPWVDRAALKFKDFWLSKAGADGVKRDWEATWRNWVRKDIDDGRGPKGRAKNEQAEQAESGRSAERVAAAMARVQGGAAAVLGLVPERDADAVLPAVSGG